MAAEVAALQQPAPRPLPSPPAPPLESASLLVERILDWCDPDEPVVLMGDLNARPGEPPILHLDRGTSTAPGLIDCWASLNPTTVEDATWNGFEVVETGPRIDYVFARGLAVRSADIERPLTAEGRPISDHWPVRARFELSVGRRNRDPAHPVQHSNTGALAFYEDVG